MKVRLFFLVVGVQLIVIAILLIRFYIKILPKTQTSPLKRESITLNPTDNLKYFFEPSSTNSFDNITPDWFKDKGLKITINKDSLNERFDYTTQKDAGVYRILVLGDSHTFGLFVSTSENYPERLEDLLNLSTCAKNQKFEVINLGVPGYAIAYSSQRYNLRGQKYHPDLILWLIEDNDFAVVEEDVYKKFFDIQKSRGVDGSAIIQVKEQIKNEVLQQKGRENIQAYQVNNLKKFLENKKMPVVLIEFNGESFSQPLSSSTKQALAGAIKDHPNVSFYEVGGISDKLMFPDGHPNQKGHGYLAQSILGYLTEKNLLSCGL